MCSKLGWQTNVCLTVSQSGGLHAKKQAIDTRSSLSFSLNPSLALDRLSGFSTIEELKVGLNEDRTSHRTPNEDAGSMRCVGVKLEDMR